MFSVASGETSNSTSMDINYIQTVYRLFSQYGQYEQWTIDAKEQWLTAILKVADSDTTTTINALLNSSVAGDDNERIDTFLGNRYGEGRAQSISVFYVLQEAWGDQFFWTLEQRSQAWNWTYQYFTNEQWDVSMATVPSSDVISPEKAEDIAWKAVSAAENLPADISQTEFIASISYGVGRNYAADYPPYYTVVFGIPITETDDQREAVTPYYSCSISNLGSVMDSSYYRATPSPTEAEGEEAPADFAPLSYSDTFSGWTLEQKAEFSQEWQPYMKDYMMERPDYRGVYYYETRNTYGLPDDKCIPQINAEELARDAARNAGATEDYLSRATAHFFFDVSESAHPLWKVYFSTIFSHDTAYQDSLGYFVILSADTGDLVDVYSRESGKALEDFR